MKNSERKGEVFLNDLRETGRWYVRLPKISKGGLFMKKVVKLAFLLACILGLIACSNNQTTSNSSSSNNNQSSSGEEEKEKEPVMDPVVLKASTHSPPGALTDAFDKFLDEIENRTEGLIMFERFYGGTLAGPQDVVDAISSGVVDVAVINPSQQSGRLALSSVASNPALYSDSWVAIKTLNELQETIPEFQAEWDKVGVVSIGAYATPPMNIMSTKSISSFDDLKGLRILTSSRPIASVISDLGATPVGMSFNEAYEAVSKGTVDGAVMSVQAGLAFGVHEVVESVWKLPISGGPGFYGISKSVWDELPKEIQETILEVKNEFQPESFYEIYQVEDEAKAMKAFFDEKVTINEPTDADIKFLMEGAAAKVWKDWVKEMDDLGLPGQDVLDTFIKVAEKYSSEKPH
ncbi:MAG: TRAP transporter substrate-binding protein DctP [Neobacillus sp.]